MVISMMIRGSATLCLVAFELAYLTTSCVAMQSLSRRHVAPDPTISWDTFGFGLNGVQTDFMWLDEVATGDVVSDHSTSMHSTSYSSSEEECLVGMGKLSLSPTATVLNYGQVLFEGLKAFRRVDGSVGLFRPERNALRMQKGAQRFLLPSVPTETFLQAVDAVVRSNAKWIPPVGGGALYLRPLLMGTGEGLGMRPSLQSTFNVYSSPVGNYFPTSQDEHDDVSLNVINLLTVRGFCRAAPGGAGGVKASGNYAPTFLVQKQVKAKGYDEVLCLDATTGESIEEAGGSNFFAIFPNQTVVTPSLESDTILDGITRSSIIELAEKECGYMVQERQLTLEEIRHASEAFCCGTGASVTPVGSISITAEDGTTVDEEKKITLGDGKEAGPLSKRLLQMLLGIQTGSDEELSRKYKDWIHIVDP